MKHLILGNGPAGVIAAETIRKRAPSDQIIMIGSEDVPPYSRMAIPYLLMGNIQESGTYLRKDPHHFDKLKIEQLYGRVDAVDCKAKELIIQGGTRISFDKLLIATGSVPVQPPIPGIQLPGVHSCWTMADARSIASIAKPGTRVLQMGAGFIGCIILEALASRDVQLTVVEMGDRMVPRMMTELAGGMIKEWVQSQGIDVFTGTRVEEISSSGSALSVKLSNGKVLEVDLVISATGVKPNIECLKNSGLEIHNGVLVNEHMQTSHPDIYAAGDVSEGIDFSTGNRIVNAIQPNAADQARIAGIAMTGGDAQSLGALQINVLDTLGLISSSFGLWSGAKDGDHVEIVDREHFKYLRLEFLGDILIGATCVGTTDHIGVLRGLIQSKTRLGEWKSHLLRDPTQAMEAYLAKGQAQSAWMN
ncbi:MAG: FAD-dependent oxidoreductase [Polynucleobacter sp. 24-46-87]|jgi:NAD(P)H-nitrite reductase large subunit|uniref:NAD(P)/FAD-dependent oxidoreductase n=2 Tax=unclassified Polynucleobacter TaxID=2640945 RepID=UPI000BD0DBED|nr:FAD-dependent oxidoreductase [Polynucleobacter sp. 35-46-11]OYY13646.1 MAG: FAD-dependent oxidoreductase [Polynucleobacter sp. 35-46-11]OZA13309.1 MAG: FAD-dependent oxidoreductase [Polynucleobacter sp. 24-46-87]